MRVIHPGYRARFATRSIGPADVYNADRARGEIHERAPVAWLAPGGVPNEGDISSWSAIVGSSTDTQSSGPLQPDALRTRFSGRLSVFFDSVGEALPWSALDLSGVDAATVLLVFVRESTGATGTLFLYGGVNGWSADALQIGVDSNDAFWVTLGAVVGSDQIHTYGIDVSTLGVMSVAVVVDRSLTGANQIKVYTPDGEQSETVFMSGAPTGNFAAAGNCWIGSENNGAASAADAWVREVAVFDSALTEAQAIALARAGAWRAGAL